ncbi:MAG: GTP 3',8-cyclase MoaA [Clostridiales bacterium]|nr:GTP 3',8-cyclase MoaA [Clostridiales bacterium]
MFDKYNRKINYMRISVTDRCNLRCEYCMPVVGVPKKSHNEILRLEEIENIALEGIKLGIDKIRLTGGEPLVRKGIMGLIGNIANAKGLKDFALTTNGLLLKKHAKELKDKGLKRVNVSIDSLNDKTYEKITKGGNLKKVLEGIEEAKKAGLAPLKLNVVLIKGTNDHEIGDFIKLTRNEEIEVRFIELMPIGEASGWSNDYHITNNVVKELFEELVPIDVENKSIPTKRYKIPNYKGTIGLINPLSECFCDGCNRIRITADGKIKPCLHSDFEINIRKLSKEGFSMAEILEKSINKKPEKHNITSEEFVPIKRGMHQVGG